MAECSEGVFIHEEIFLDVATFVITEGMEVLGIEGDGERELFKVLLDLCISHAFHRIFEVSQRNDSFYISQRLKQLYCGYVSSMKSIHSDLTFRTSLIAS